MTHVKRSLLWSSLIAGSIVLAGCTNKTDDEKKDGDSTVELTGKTIDGYLRYATVCLDLSGDGYCQISSEPLTTTESDGSYALSVTAEQQADPNFSSAQLVVYGGQDSDTGKAFNNKLQAPFDGTSGTINVSPLSTMVAAVIKNSTTTITSEEAKTKVANMLGLETADLNKDPIAEATTGSAKLLSAATQLQKAIEVLVKAAVEDTETFGSLDEKSATDAIFSALAKSVITQQATATKSASANAGVNAMIDNAASADLGTKANAIKVAAKTMANNIKAVIAEDATTLDTNEIGAAALTIDGTKEAFVAEVATKLANTTDFTQAIVFDTAIISDNAFSDHEVTADSLKTSLVTNLLAYIGITVDQTTAESIATLTDVKAGMTLEELKTVLSANNSENSYTDLITTIEEKLAGLTNDTTDTQERIDIAADVSKLLSPTATADVADAKNMVSQLRETALTFFAEDPLTGEVNSSTILGKQMGLFKTKIEPAVQDVADDLNVTFGAIGTMSEAFGTALESDFGVTMTSLETRMQQLSDLFAANEGSDSWSGSTASGDNVTFSHSLTTGTTPSESISLTITNTNGTNISASGTVDGGTYDSTNQEWTSITTATLDVTNNVFKGTGYSLTVSEISVDVANDAGTFVFKSSGSLTGANSASMTLTALNISVSGDETEDALRNKVSNIEFEFDGSITAGGKTLEGKLVISEADATKNMLSGKFSGSAADPIIEGTIVPTINLNSLKDAIDDGDKSIEVYNSYWSRSPMTIATDLDGTNYLITSRNSVSSSYNNTLFGYESNSTVEYTLHTGDKITCDSSSMVDDWADTGFQQRDCNVSGTVTTIYNNYIVELTLGSGGTWQVKDFSAYSTSQYLGLSNSNNDWIELAIDSTGIVQRWSNTEGMYVADSITNVSMRKAKVFEDLSSSFTVDASITHGTNVIAAKATATRKPFSKSWVYKAENVNVTNGESHLQATLISTEEADDMWTLMESGYTSALNYAETYTNIYDDYEDTLRSVKAEGLDIKIVDADNESLTFTADMSYTQSGNALYTGSFNGTYAYRGTTFTGIIEFDVEQIEKLRAQSEDYQACYNYNISYVGEGEGNYTYGSTGGYDYVGDGNGAFTFQLSYSSAYTHGVDSWYTEPTIDFTGNVPYSYTLCNTEWQAHSYNSVEQYPTGTAKIKGEVSANGFQPFSVAMTADATATSVTSSLLFTRGSNDEYKLALKGTLTGIGSTSEYEKLLFGDSNGVVFTIAGPAGKDAQDITSVTFTDKDDTPLATYGETANGNNWEIVYTDGTSESIF